MQQSSTVTDAVYPLPLPDESIESFLVRSSRLAHVAGTGGFSAASIPSIRIDPFGRSSRQRAVWRSETLEHLESSEREALSYYDFFKPFIEAKLPFGANDKEVAKVLFRGDGVPKYCAEELKNDPAHCVRCTEEDVENRGYSYWRRKHQLRCNRLCLKHRAWTMSACPNCLSPFRFDCLPALECPRCSNDLRDSEHLLGDGGQCMEIFARVAHCVDLIFDGQIRNSLHLERFGMHVQSVVPCRTAGAFNNVARRLRQEVGEDLLRELHIHPAVRPFFGWPASYLSGQWTDARPTFELVLFSTLGIGLREDDYWLRNDESTQRNRHGEFGVLDYKFLRAMYRSRSWSDAADRLSMSREYASKAYGTYPGLKTRIESFRKLRQAGHRSRPYS